MKAPRLIEHLGKANSPASPAFPVHVLVTLRPPELHELLFLLMHGNETFVLAFESEDHADRVLREGHKAVNDGRPLLKVDRLISARVILGGNREWRPERS